MPKTMASSCNDICTPCQDNDGDVRQAVTRCTECEVFLCLECEFHHRKLPLSKLHKVMSTEDYHTLPTFIKKISNQCIYHNQKFELYCSFHGCPCCIQCFSEHQKCQNMKSLSDFLSQNESAASVNLLEKDLIYVVEKNEIILDYLERRKSINNNQRQQAIDKIRTTMESLDEHLNTLEKNCIGVLESRFCDLKFNMSSLVEQIKHRSDKLRKLHEEFSNMIQYATGLQVFISLKKVEQRTNEAAKYIDDLVSGGQLNESNIEIKISRVLQSLIQRVKSFGDIFITTSPSTIQLNPGNKDQVLNHIHNTETAFRCRATYIGSSNRKSLPIRRIDTIEYSKDHRYCTPCRDDEEVLNQSVKWCTECDVFLCLKCEKEHRKNPSSKHHEIMSAEEYSQLPAFVKNLSYQCKDHNLKFELYCSFHDSLCCVQCLYKHKSCQDIKPLSDTLLHIKSSAALDLAEEDFINVEENFEVILNYLKTRIEENNNQKTKVIEEVHSTRKSIDNHLNMLEQQLLENLESKHTSLISSMNTLLTQIDDRSAEISNLHAEISQITQVATELQLYIGLEEIDEQTSEATQYIEDLEREGHLNEHDLEIELSADVQSILDDVESFGDIHITTSFCSVKVKAGRKHFVQMVSKIEQINPSLLRTLTVPDEIRPIDVNACRILPDGNFLILNQYQNQLLLFTHDGIFTGTVVTLNERANDVCLVRNDKVAVAFTSCKSNQTSLFDIEKNEITKTIELSHDCSAVTSDGQILVISSVCTKNSTIVNLDDMTHKNFEGVWGNRISLFKENIYCTDYKGDKIRCYKRTGTLLWTFVHNEISYPSGLALDINGFVYIASSENNTIVVVSPDGKTSKTIKSNADGVITPTGIDINRGTGIMIVSCQVNNDRPRILLFKIEMFCQ